MFAVARPAAALAFALTLAGGPPARAAERPDSAERTIQAIRKSPRFQAAQRALARDHDRIVADTIALTEIEAPPFQEARRAQAYLGMLRAQGLDEVEQDSQGNVMGLRRGTGPAGGPVVVIAAHLDTVFPAGTDVRVRRQGTRLQAPGVGDDSHALSVLLGYARALDAGRIRTRRDILFVGDVGEEGPGDLRGVRHLLTTGRYKGRVAAFFSVDGTQADRITHAAVGSRRYRVTFKGPGGHAYGAFGLVNPMVAMANTVVELNRLRPPLNPRTTYMTSVVGGGTSVNSIPDAVWLEVDLRSESADELARLDARFGEIVRQAVDQENAARSTRLGPIRAELIRTGDRPAGAMPLDAPIVRLTVAAVRAAGYAPQLGAGSTDANLPISLGIPAVTIGAGGTGGRAHAMDEWIDVARPESLRGMAVGLSALIAMAGLEP